MRCSLVLLLLALILSHARAESPRPVPIEGTVTYTGPLPRGIPVIEAGTVRELIEVDPRTKGLKNALIWLEGARATEEEKKQKPPLATMDQSGFFFRPHVLALRAGQEVEFTNSDSANHCVQAVAAEGENTFNVITAPGNSYKHRFVKSRRAISVRCPIHASMAAWIYVFDHPYYTISDAQGNFRLPAVPPGKYTLHVEHFEGRMVRREVVEVKPGAAMKLTLEFKRDDLKLPVPSKKK